MTAVTITGRYNSGDKPFALKKHKKSAKNVKPFVLLFILSSASLRALADS
jgi:hypothetical protein